MEYGNNILPTQGAMYQLHNATIENGILKMLTGGSLKYEFTEAEIVRLTEYFRVSLVAEPYTNRYIPKVKIQLHIWMKDGTHYNATVFSTQPSSGVFSQELQLKAGEYKTFTFEIVAQAPITFTLWELCPEAADEDIQVIIDGVEQSLPKLLFDYNMWPLMIDQDEKTISLISLRLLDHTDLQGHFQLTYVASEACTLTLRFKDNGSTELFSPLLYDLHAGRGSVGVPHAYLTRLAGIHSLIVTAQVSSGTVAVDTRGILFTVDGGYLAERTIDIGVDVRDISIRQLSQDYGPDEIWIIGIEAGEAIVRKRKYDPKATITFEPQYSLGQAKQAAIEFNGIWVLRPDDDNYTIETEEYPWQVWINDKDELLAQLGADETTKIVIDSGVSNLYVCRGYKSETFLNQDQGLVVVYIKSGRVYYIQYAYNVTAKVVRWSEIYELDETLSNVQNVAIQRLNDFRLGISVVLTNETRLYITERTYVSQAVPREVASLSAPSRSLFAYYPSDYDTSLTLIDQEISEDRLCLKFTVNQIIQYDGYDIKEVITFNDSIPEYDEETSKEYVKDIKLVVDDIRHTTQFIVNLNLPPIKLITEVYVNKVQSYDLQEQVSAWGWIMCPTITIQYDTTNYVTGPTQADYAKLGDPITCGFVYRGLGFETRIVQETAQLSTPNIPGFEYNQIDKPQRGQQEIASLSNPITCGFAYQATSDKPI